MKNLKKTYLETINEEEFQAIPAVANVKKILAGKSEAVENQIIYTPESAAAALDATIRVFPIPEAQLEYFTVPEKPNAWEFDAWKVREALTYEQYEVPRSSKNFTFADLCELGRSLLPHRDSPEWIDFLRRTSFTLPKEITCLLLAKNFDVTMTQAQGFDATAYKPACLLLTAWGIAWFSKNEVIQVPLKCPLAMLRRLSALPTF